MHLRETFLLSLLSFSPATRLCEVWCITFRQHSASEVMISRVILLPLTRQCVNYYRGNNSAREAIVFQQILVLPDMLLFLLLLILLTELVSRRLCRTVLWVWHQGREWSRTSAWLETTPSNVCVSGGTAPCSLKLATRWMQVISYMPLLLPGKESSATIVWSAAWSSVPFWTQCDLLLGLQCRSGRCLACWLVLSAVSWRCLACCLVFSAVPDAAWRAAWSSLPFRTLLGVLLGPQCRSGRCLACCLVLSAVPDADADLRFRSSS